MAVVGRELIMPLALSGSWIERHHRTREQIIALANRVIAVGTGVADGPVEHVQIRIVSAGQPTRRAAALPAIARPGVVPEFTRLRNRIKTPDPLSRGGVVSIHITGETKLA